MTKTVLIAITKHGAIQTQRLAKQMPTAEIVVSEKFASLMVDIDNSVNAYSGAFRSQIARLFIDYDQLIFFVSLGAVVRLIAPHLKSKDEDPAVVVIDDACTMVKPK